ncbi:alpha/beta fold hydrolase [Actinomadura flavalba]|uniref:alpha/beta fold hydrolase n=1 Tax=Actinomadura flavalba TaxID=1120938 RepID=UPI00037B395C|nr:alpha/beta fold hydrolase [Actinomadura flavalba]
MERVTSADGTEIAFRQGGVGPAVVLVGGTAADHTDNEPLAAELAAQFTVYNYDRRGRGGSGDTLPYSVEREFEDLAALIAHAGGSACVYGISSGGALVLAAAVAGVPMERLAVYEVPYDMTDGAPERYRAYADRLDALLAEGRRDDAFVAFLREAESTEEDIAAARSVPTWPELTAIAHTLAYDAAMLGDGRPPAGLTDVAVPALIVTGGGAYIDAAAAAIAQRLPHAERHTLEGQPHSVDPTVLAPLLEDFFTR